MTSLTRVTNDGGPDTLRRFIDRLNAAARAGDGAAFGGLFLEDGYWKDLLSLTWDFKTFAGRQAIGRAFADTASRAGLRNFRIAPGRTPPAAVRRSGRQLIEAYLEFETDAGIGAAFLRLADGPEPAIWQLLTALDHLHGFAEKVDGNRPSGEKYSKLASAESWRQKREREQAYAERDPEVLIVGAGQGGLMLAARLKQMEVDTLVIDRTARVGDVWRERYNNLTLHNELTANHFPYMPFPSNWPLWLPKDMLADWLEAYAKFQELNVWTGVELAASTFDAAGQIWDVVLRRPDGSERRMRVKHVVAAMGISGGAPKRPALPGLGDFRGTVQHSAEFSSGADWAGKRALVIGTGNSGHDVAQDLHVGGAADVRLVQRGPTCVVSLQPSAAISYAVYSEGRPVDDVDLMVATIPYPVLIDTYQSITRKTNSLDFELLRRLNAAGFKTTDGEDGTGFQLLYLRGGGGYYIDVGCCELILEGKVGLMQAEDMERFVPEGLRLRDGTVLPLDLVVLATGFEGMDASIRRLFGAQVADRVGPVWGFDEDRNMRAMWKRTGQPNFWVMGGAIIEARTFSRYLALQIKASLEGLMPQPGSMPLERAERAPEAVA